VNRNLIASLFVVIIFATLNTIQVPAARASGGGGSSLGSVSGTYGFNYNGVAVTPTGAVPVAAVGNFHTGAAGNFAGTEINNLGRSATRETIMGTITVRPDCASSLVTNVYEAGVFVRTSYIHLQYEFGVTELQAIFEKVVLPDNSILQVVITINGKRVFQGQ
jgi:hypothetical protein